MEPSILFVILTSLLPASEVCQTCPVVYVLRAENFARWEVTNFPGSTAWNLRGDFPLDQRQLVVAQVAGPKFIWDLRENFCQV